MPILAYVSMHWRSHIDDLGKHKEVEIIYLTGVKATGKLN